MKLKDIDPILAENIRRIREYPSGWFSLGEHFGSTKPIVRNYYAEGSFNDPQIYTFQHIITEELLNGTMKEIARLSKANGWHKGSFCGTQLVDGTRRKRSLLKYLGKTPL